MDKIRVVLAAVTLTVFAVSFAGYALADSAEVLPKGVSRVSLTYSHYLPIEEEFDDDGNAQGVDDNYNGLPVTAIVPGLDIGVTVIDFEYLRDEAYLSYQYGLSDKITLGIVIPYFWLKSDVSEASVDTSTGNAAVLGSIGCAPGDDACATAFLLGAIQGPPFDFAAFETWSDSGLGDIQVGMRYQYYKTDPWKLAFTGSIQIPTGEEDDPDNLIDLDFGTGAYALIFRLNNDYTVNDRLTLNGTLFYDLYLPDEPTLRVYNDPDLPVVPSANTEKVDRDYGDDFGLELGGDYSLSDTFSLGLLYRYGTSPEDSFSGSGVLNYGALEEETKEEVQTMILSLNYSTIQKYMDKKASVPMEVGLAYRNRFGGVNVYKSEYVALGLNLYF